MYTSTIVSHTNNRPSHRQNPFHSGGVPRRRMLLLRYPGSARACGSERGVWKKVVSAKETSSVGGGKGSAKVHCHGAVPRPMGKVALEEYAPTREIL